VAISATQDAAVRHFTNIFKSIFRIGSKPEPFILDTWAVVKAAALAEHARTKQPGLLNAVAFVEKLVGIVCGLPKPDMSEDDDDKQADLPVDGAKTEVKA
jgi:hypothetical protein